MKSSRSASTQNIRRNARRIISESSDDDSGRDASKTHMDSARAEKIFSRRRLQKSSSNLDNKNDESIYIQAERTLFRVSDTSDSESSHEISNMAKKKPGIKKESSIQNNESISELSMNESLFQPSKNNLLKYRNALQSSDDEPCSSIKNNIAKKKSGVKKESSIQNNESISDLSMNESLSHPSKNDLFKYINALQSSDDEQCSIIKNNLAKKKLGVNKESPIQNNESISELSMNESLFQPSKNDLLKYRNALQSSDDEQCSSSKNDMLNDSSGSEKNSASVDSGEDGILEEYTDKSISSSKNFIDNESFFITPKKIKNKQRIILDSSDESEDEEKTTKHSIVNETNNILESDSDDDIVNSSKEIFTTPLKVNKGKCEIEMKLKDLSLIEPSDSDNDISTHYKSTIASSNQNRPFIDDIKFSNTTHGPISQSSILENSSFEVLSDKSNNQKIEKNIEVITLDDDSPKTSTVSSSVYNPQIIDLTGDAFNKESSVSLITASNKNLEKLTISDFKSLKMEKERLEDVLKRFTKNINNMKNTMKVTNLHLLPDGGLKLSRAILKEESAFKDTQMQLKNVDQKLKKFQGSVWNHEETTQNIIPPNFNLPNIPSNNKALIKKAATNIDIGAMGQKALSTYQTQQTMTLDVLHSLHKSLETCPNHSILPDDPSGLKVELMDHQKYALAWLMWRENQKPHGGILADDMGLGKTLTMISLILNTLQSEKKRDYSYSDSDMDDSLENSRFNNIKGGTLIICPSSLISQWQNEVKNKVRSRMLDVVQHYGPNRESSARRLARKDVVITTYHVVMWDHKSHKNTSPLFQIKWRRIILDEAHTIRNCKSQTSIAVSELLGVNRWALSGTPIHNKEADFYALLKFIKCRPFDDWPVWKRWVGNNDEAGKNRLSLLVKALMLRRTKAELSESTSFKLPLKTTHNIKVELMKEEKEAYEKVLHFSSKLFATYLYEKAEKENVIDRGFPVHNKVKYLHQTDLEDDIFQDHPELDKLFKQLKNNKNIQAHHILVLLLRLRQLCCHPCLMKNMLEDETLTIDGIKETKDIDLVDHMSRMSIGVSNHVEKQTLINSNPIFNDSWVSSKIKAVCDMVKEKVLHTDDKAIIVSQWPSMLNLIAKQLSQYKVKTELFSGAVPMVHRNKIVDEFNNLKGGVKILLLSLTAGGVGLNLVAANHLFMVDIHWNPQLEAQACDRIYRVGQKKPVHIYKFLCDNTIETSIQSIQNNKLEIASNLFGGCRNIEGTKITLDDLKQIFNINPKK